MSNIASPTKLRTGEWGAKVQGSVDVGDVITIRTRSGKEWKAIVSHVVWEGNGVSICATQNGRTRTPARRVGGQCATHSDPLSFGIAPGFTGRCPECGCRIYDAC